MRHRSLTTALLVLVLMLASAGPANALFDIGGVIQRAQMIVNQATQIANQIRQMRTMTRQLTELEEQLDYMKDVARGEVDALVEPFAELVGRIHRTRRRRPRLGLRIQRRGRRAGRRGPWHG